VRYLSSSCLGLGGLMLKQTKPISDERAQWLAAHIVPHEAALRAWLKGKTSPGCDVDDIVQETYAILATKRAVDTINNPKTYAFQVAYSVILQQLRHSRVVPIAAVADIAALETPVDEPSLEDAAIARDELRQVEIAIDALPRQTRTAFILRRVEGLSQQAIARRMGLSEHTIEKHISRGIKLLLAQFGRGGNSAVQASREKERPDEIEDSKAQRKIPR
jgi:RNA polymerase sigma factor (sigma-70 family)